MKLIERTPEALRCIIAQCPAVFETDRNTYVVIGKQMKAEEITELVNDRIGDGEIAVEFPKELLANLLSHTP